MASGVPPRCVLHGIRHTAPLAPPETRMPCSPCHAARLRFAAAGPQTGPCQSAKNYTNWALRKRQNLQAGQKQTARRESLARQGTEPPGGASLVAQLADPHAGQNGEDVRMPCHAASLAHEVAGVEALEKNGPAVLRGMRDAAPLAPPKTGLVVAPPALRLMPRRANGKPGVWHNPSPLPAPRGKGAPETPN